jgi:hypothetical protein
MSTHPKSGVELVRRIIEGDLKTFWVMFNHIKRVHDWTTMGVHVYDFFWTFVDHCFVCHESIRSQVLEFIVVMFQ